MNPYIAKELEDYLSNEIKNFNIKQFAQNINNLISTRKEKTTQKGEEFSVKPNKETKKYKEIKDFDSLYEKDEIKKHYSFFENLLALIYELTRVLMKNTNIERNKKVTKLDIINAVKDRHTIYNLTNNIKFYLAKYSNKDYIDVYDFLIDALKSFDNKNINKAIIVLFKKWNLN